MEDWAIDRITGIAVVFISLVASCTITVYPAIANSKTIVVPDDCQTISDAIENALDGDTIFVRNGTYEEKTLETNKTLTLIGEDARFTKIILDPPIYDSTPPSKVIVNGTAYEAPWANQTWFQFGSSIRIFADDFKLSGFTIKLHDTGDYTGGEGYIIGNRTQIIGNIMAVLLSVNGSHAEIRENAFSDSFSANGSYSNIVKNSMEDVAVAGFYSNFADNQFSGAIWAYGSYLNISSNNKATSNKIHTGDFGIRLEGSSSLICSNSLTAINLDPGINVIGGGNTIYRNIVDHADVGIKVAGSNNIICANTITNSLEKYFFPNSNNPVVGIGLEVSGNNTLYANYVANNSWGVDINKFPEANLTSTLYHNNFVRNEHQVATDDNAGIYGDDSFDNGEEGNFWSDYNGTDAGGDGIGDMPYVIDDKRSDRYPLMTPFDISTVPLERPEPASSSPSATPSPQLSSSPPPSASQQTPATAAQSQQSTYQVALITAAATAIAITVTAAVVLLRKKQQTSRPLRG